MRDLTIYATSYVLNVFLQTDIAEGYLGRKIENYRGSMGKLILTIQLQPFQAQLLWSLEAAKVGTGAWHFLLWILYCARLRASLKQNTTKVQHVRDQFQGGVRQ